MKLIGAPNSIAFDVARIRIQGVSMGITPLLTMVSSDFLCTPSLKIFLGLKYDDLREWELWDGSWYRKGSLLIN
jgi:hypothetical protein